MNQDSQPETSINEIRNLFRGKVQSQFGITDTSGVEIARLVGIIANFFTNSQGTSRAEKGLTDQRWGILLRLYLEEQIGNDHGITATRMGRLRFVKKNTMSVLLNGLEQQGSIERVADEQDKRFFRVKLTQQGRDLVRKVTPSRLRKLNHLGSGLAVAEKEQLIQLLGKLLRSIIVHSEVKFTNSRGNHEKE